MKNNYQEINKGDSIQKNVLTGTSFSAGLIHGYYDGQNIPLGSEMVEDLLTYGPALLGASVVSSKLATSAFHYGNEKLEERVLPKSTVIGGIILGSSISLGVFGTFAALTCGAITAAGYATGYAAGRLLQ